jgi:hypothetical protein
MSQVRRSSVVRLVFSLLVMGTSLFAVDGIIEINQTAALAGGVTSGDGAGFPVTISGSGSYRLTGNLVVPDANTTAVVVSQVNVTLDLNGFSILGSTSCSQTTPGSSVSCTGTGSGKGIDASVNNVTVLNGTIRGMGNDGINLSSRARVEGLSVISNGADGMDVGTDSLVVGNRATLNGSEGVTEPA